MVQKALEKQKKDFDKAIAKATKEFEEKLRMVLKNQNRGRESWSRLRNPSKKSTSRSQDSKSRRSRSRSRSHSPMAKTGKTHPARQNHTTRRHLTPRPSRSISPRRERSRLQKSVKFNKEDCTIIFENSESPAVVCSQGGPRFIQPARAQNCKSSQDAHVSNRGGRGRGRGLAVEVEVNHHLDWAEVRLGIHAINKETITTKAEVEGSLSNTEETEEKFGEDFNLPTPSVKGIPDWWKLSKEDLFIAVAEYFLC